MPIIYYLLGNLNTTNGTTTYAILELPLNFSDEALWEAHVSFRDPSST